MCGCVSTRVYTMNHSVWTGVYSDAGLSVSITPPRLSLPGPLSTQTYLNTHTQRQEAPHAECKTLYTRPCCKHIMGLSGVWGLGGSWRNPTPKQRRPRKRLLFWSALTSTHVQTQLLIITARLTLFSLISTVVSNVLKQSHNLTQGQFNILLQWSDVAMKHSELGPYQFLQTMLCWNPVNSVLHRLWVRSDSTHVCIC